MHPTLWLALIVVAFLGFQRADAGGSGGPDARGLGCPAALLPATGTVTVSQLERLVAETGLRRLSGGGTADVEGLQQAGATRFSAVPSSSFDRLASSAVVGAGYEIRWWSTDQDHQSAGVFLFRSSGDAERFVERLATPRCRRQPVSYRLARPAGARALIWTNPLGVREADVFFARGSRAYRLVDVPPPTYLQGRFSLDAAELVAPAQLLACGLKQAGCKPPTPRPVFTPAGYDALKLFIAGASQFRSLPPAQASAVFSRECVAIGRFWDPEARLIYQGCQVDWHYLNDRAYGLRCQHARPCQQWAIGTAAADLYRMAKIERQVAGQLTAGACRAAWNRYAALGDQLGRAFGLYGRALVAHDGRALKQARLLSRDADRDVDPFAPLGSCAPHGASLGLPQSM